MTAKWIEQNIRIVERSEQRDQVSFHDGFVVKPIPGWKGYWARADGSVLSVKSFPMLSNAKILQSRIGSRGYLQVKLTEGGKSTTKNVHSLIASAFFGRKPTGCVCRHLNGVKTDNSVANLRWGTPSQNSIDSVEHGTRKAGTVSLTNLLVWVHKIVANAADLYGDESLLKARNRIRKYVQV